MENKKSNKGLVIFLIFVILVLLVGLGLLLGGVIKNPFEKETNTKTVEKVELKEENEQEKTEEIKETRYYQRVSKGNKCENNPDGLNYEEMVLNPDGTVELVYYCIMSYPSTWEGIYVENDKYISIFLNAKDYKNLDYAVEPIELLLFKDNNNLINTSGTYSTVREVYYFDKADLSNDRVYNKVDKSDLKTILKD